MLLRLLCVSFSILALSGCAHAQRKLPPLDTYRVVTPNPTAPLGAMHFDKVDGTAGLIKLDDPALPDLQCVPTGQLLKYDAACRAN